jgi:hypothetical protein
MAGHAVTLLSVGMTHSDLTQDIWQTYEKSLAIAPVMNGMDLNRSEVQNHL